LEKERKASYHLNTTIGKVVTVNDYDYDCDDGGDCKIDGYGDDDDDVLMSE
jgi:hypothetical protein